MTFVFVEEVLVAAGGLLAAGAAVEFELMIVPRSSNV